jgi:hypothetical protein
MLPIHRGNNIMPISSTPRFTLPLLNAAQAHKEITHNEALLLADALLLPAVQSLALNTPPPAPQAGRCWIIGAAPNGAWAEFAHHMAVFTEGGWRFIAPVTGMQVWITPENLFARYANMQWVLPGTAIAPVGGTTADSEARSAIAAIIVLLQQAGLCAP